MNGHPQFDEDFDLYALGALEGDEKQELEAHLGACADCAHKLEEARGRLALLSLAAAPVAPPPRVRERLLRQVQPRTVTQQIAPRFSNFWRLATPALAVACLVLIMVLGTFRTENHDLRRRIDELQLAADIQMKETARARAVLDVLTAPDTFKVTLVSGSAPPAPQGKAFYHPRKGLLFYAANLPVLPAGRTYQLWLVPAQGIPISAGIFQTDAQGNGEVLLPSLPSDVTPKAFAVTDEPAGGVPQPTGTKILVGAVS